MSRTGENIYKRKDGRYEARYIKSYDAVGNAKYGYIYSHSYSDVKLKQQLAIAESRLSVPASPSSTLPLSEVASRWLLKTKPTVKPATFSKYHNVVTLQILPFLGKYPIAKLSGELIDSFVTHLRTSARNDAGAYSPKTIQDICTILNSILTDAEETYGVRLQFPRRKLKIPVPHTETVVLTPQQLSILLTYLNQDINLYKLGIIISIYTGIRLGELCALQWSDIDLASGTLSITKTLQRLQHLDKTQGKTTISMSSPKTFASNRLIPLPTFLLNTIAPFAPSSSGSAIFGAQTPSRTAIFGANSPSDFVLTGSQTPADPRTIQYNFKKYLSACSLPPVKFHALRHTFATRSIELGFDVKTLSEILGHSSVAITLNRYVHSSFVSKQSSMDKLASLSDFPSKF